MNPLDQLIQRTGSLYSLPAVAMEVVRLTGQEGVDPRAIKEAVEGDPALTAKILRVVNSSMFGLSGTVANLTQALALLGVRPLKLLVLGFSLPDRLFADLAGDQLRDYWTAALTRAVAARTIATDWFGAGGDTRLPVSGDDAFVAALLRDIGLLVLIQELGEPYVTFLRTTGAAGEVGAPPRHLLERDSLGFDHVELTVALLKRWQLPATLIAAVGTPASPLGPQRSGGDDTPRLAEVVRLADLLTQLVVARRLSVLPELLKRGEAACGLTRPMVNGVVETLEDRVRALADALQTPIVQEADYGQVLFDAHAQMAMVAEAAAGSGLDDDALSEALLAESHELRLTMRRFLNKRDGASAERIKARTEPAHAPGAAAPRVDLNPAARARLEQAIAKLANRCRLERTDLSLAMIAVEGATLDPNDRVEERRVEAAIQQAGDSLVRGRAARLTLSDRLLAVLLPAVDKRAAIAFCEDLQAALSGPPRQPATPAAGADPPTEAETQPLLVTDDQAPSPMQANDAAEGARLSAGVASIVAVPNRFDPARLIEGATRCLLAAQGQYATAAAGVAIKSIEVYY
ncbi:MAG: HDOD domain-containing protein [Planctomycetota bacterium]